MDNLNVPAFRKPRRKKPQRIGMECLSTYELKKRLRALRRKIKKKEQESKGLEYEIRTRKLEIRDQNYIIELVHEKPLAIVTVLEKIVWEEADECSGVSTRAEGLILGCSRSIPCFTSSSGLLGMTDLQAGDKVAVRLPMYSIIEKLDREFSLDVRALEVLERPGDTFNTIAGYEAQILELMETVILPLEQRERFAKIGIKPARGVLLHGPPGTGKTSMVLAAGRSSGCTLLRVAASQLAGIYLGEGARLVREIFQLARHKAPTILIIEDIDAIGMKRRCHENSNTRHTNLTLVELLSHMDGCSTEDDIMVIATTNRVESLDQALVRSGRFDKKIEVPFPGHRERVAILEQYSRKLVMGDVDLEEVARELENWSGAHCRAVCMEAGMVAIRRNATWINCDDFQQAVNEVRAKRDTVSYFA